MSTKKKLELQPNEPQILTILADPIVGKNDYGPYYLFMVSNGKEEFSFFAPNEQIYQQLKSIGKGKNFEITKTAKKNGKSITVEYNVVSLDQEKKAEPVTEPIPHNSQDDFYYDTMRKSVSDAIKIQNMFPGVCSTNSIAVTIYISRLKQTPSFDGG